MAAAARAEALASLALLDTPPEARYDGLAELARELIGSDVAYVSFHDVIAPRLFFKAASLGAEARAHGFTAADTPLREGLPYFCVEVCDTCTPLVVLDAAADERWARNPFVAAGVIRFYAGVPLCVRPGVAVGSVCVISVAPRAAWSAADAKALAAIAAQVLVQMRRGAPAAVIGRCGFAGGDADCSCDALIALACKRSALPASPPAKTVEEPLAAEQRELLAVVRCFLLFAHMMSCCAHSPPRRSAPPRR